MRDEQQEDTKEKAAKQTSAAIKEDVETGALGVIGKTIPTLLQQRSPAEPWPLAACEWRQFQTVLRKTRHTKPDQSGVIGHAELSCLLKEASEHMQVAEDGVYHR